MDAAPPQHLLWDSWAARAAYSLGIILKAAVIPWERLSIEDL